MVTQDGMEVIIRNIPEQASPKSLRDFLRTAFKPLQISIDNVNCHKNRDRSNAILTFLHVKEGQLFINHHGSVRPEMSGRSIPATKYSRNLIFLGRKIYCQRSNQGANPHLMRVLQNEAAQRKAAQAKHHDKIDAPDIFPISFGCVSLSCGIWSYENGDVVFLPQTTLKAEGIAKLWHHNIIVTLNNGLRLEFQYSAIRGITIDDSTSSPCFMIHMTEPPRFFEKISSPVEDLLAQLGISIQAPRQQTRMGPTLQRIPYLNEEHKATAGTCLVYQVMLRRDLFQAGEFDNKIQSFSKARPMIPTHHQTVRVPRNFQSHVEGFAHLQRQLESYSNPMLFSVKFQIQKLAQGGYIPPDIVLMLMESFIPMSLRSPESARVAAIRALFHQIPYAEPDTEAENFSIEGLVALLKDNLESCTIQKQPSETQISKSGNVAFVHRAKVTPSGIILSGPEQESSNRVLRKYSKHHDYFLRVTFCDEDGGMIGFDPNVSLEKIYHGRFKDILHKGIQIADRTFTFLGFSHSSLRGHTCWFAAPFLHEGQLTYGRHIIQDLGDFSMIRSPAKCAARIGQAFSDTRTAIPIDENFITVLPDVQRNGRVFSDGVGTMSPSVMEMICDHLPKRPSLERPRPSCLQIRFKGAKGMISVDYRLRGNIFALRQSMIKFEGSNSKDVEICGAAYKPLPLYLNRQFIKILEDMGVGFASFLKLQNQEVQRLRTITNNPWDVSMFLHHQSIGQPMNMARFIQELADRNIDFRADPFLRNVLEASLLLEIRELKHKTRIPVPKGYVLHGIMDETGFLQEGQVFCTFNDQNGAPVIPHSKRLLISRAPALHPGDVQLAKAVRPPAGSPLLKLSNCICFSQRGSRDLPSMLSGGDLDGDLYHVIWDESLMPTTFFIPADYPRVMPIDIGRPVQSTDMTDFFIKFMETDQLGRIAIRHLVLADQKALGTRDPDCILLAGMHSTAVDFSKTGIPVDMTLMPPGNNWRPDFMAPGPNVHVDTTRDICFDDDVYQNPNEMWNEFEENKGYRYYESHKALGKLYRAIDERKVLRDIQSRETGTNMNYKSTAVDAVWDYVKKKMSFDPVEHHLEWARILRDTYENCIRDAMTEYSDHPMRPLTELEVFIGNILGKTGAASKRQRELSVTLKEKVEGDTTFIIDCILKDDNEPSEEALERSIACLKASMEEKISFRRDEQMILSFKYIAAAICMREAEKLPGFEVLSSLDQPTWLNYGGQY